MPQVLSLRESLVNGLRPELGVPAGGPFMYEYSAMKPSRFGARLHETVSLAIAASELESNGVLVKHPFPQLFKGKGITLLADKNHIYEVDESDWTLTAIETYDLYTPANYYDTDDHYLVPSSGAPWQFVDFHSSWFLFNGACQVFPSKWVHATKVFVQDSVTMTTGCDFQGRMMTGGFDSTDFWSKVASGGLSSSMLPKAIEYGFTLADPGTNWIWWSMIGGGNLLEFFIAGTVIEGIDEAAAISGVGGYDSDSPLYIDHMRRLCSGMMPMDWQGTVYNIRPLRGGKAVVYGTDGISAVMGSSDPVPTMGLVDNLLRIGIASRNAVGGDLQRQFFVDDNGVAWMVNSDLQLQRLGYEEYLSPMLGTEVIVSYDPRDREFYISNEDVSYIYTETGMAECPVRATSVFRIEGGLAGIFHETSVDEVISNGEFTGNANDWTLGAGWTYGSNHLIATTASGDVTQVEADQTTAMEVGKTYRTAYRVTRSAGTVWLYLGDTQGGARAAAGYYIEDLECTTTTTVKFATSGFTGTVDDVTVREVLAASDIPLALTTVHFDNGQRTFDTIEKVTISTDLADTLEVDIAYRFDTGGLADWLWAYSGSPIAVDERGVARVAVSGVDFAVKVTADDFTVLAAITDILVQFRGGAKVALKPRLTA